MWHLVEGRCVHTGVLDQPHYPSEENAIKATRRMLGWTADDAKYAWLCLYLLYSALPVGEVPEMKPFHPFLSGQGVSAACNTFL